jgi:uncharacterized repeat protein (TIGR03803 family)
LVQATDGNFYGTTAYGGASANCYLGCGTVFKITPLGTLTTLHSFNGTDGEFPFAGLVQGTDGNLHGTTTAGGANGRGTVFSITSAGSLTTIYSFCAQSNCTDGANPYGDLVQATKGNFYGTTSAGGANGQGTVFSITPGGFLTTIYSFCAQSNCTDGANPYGGLVQATNANLYGTTAGGGNGGGTVFSITPGGSLTTIYSFCALIQCTDGFGPAAVLVQADGNFYGTTGDGGDATNCNPGCGTVFRVTAGGGFTTLYAFDFTHGAYPWGLVQATDGNFYGATEQGGAYGTGTVFKLGVAFVFTLNVSTAGSGTVISSDGNINCGTACSFNYPNDYPNGAPVTLTATPAQGWALTGWSGCDAVQGDVCKVSIYQARNVTATFTATSLLTVTSGGGGTLISGDSRIHCGNVCAASYPNGTILSLTAMPAVGFTVNNWSGCTSFQGNICRIAINAPVSVSAAFTSAPVTFRSLTFNPSTARHGSIAVGSLTFSVRTPSSGITIGVRSSQPAIVNVPSTLYIPGGVSSFRFGASVIGARPITVTITATDGTSSVAGTLGVVPGSRAARIENGSADGARPR